MPDHDDLSPFTDGFSEGMHVNPIPASEVRRRGDRMRRRNTAVAAVGGVVAAAVFIGTPLALVNARDDGRGPQPAPSAPTTTDGSASPDWVTTIPDDFPLDDGFPETNGDGSDTSVVRDDPEADLEVPAYVELCGLTWPSDMKPQDWATIDYTGETEDHASRALYLHDDAETADLVLDLLRTNVRSCPSLPTSGGDSVIESRLVDGDLGTEKSLVVAQQVREDDGLISGLTLTEVGLSGNAIYVTQSYGSAGGDQVIESETARLRERSATPLAAMCVFSAEPCAGGEAAGDPETASTVASGPVTVGDGTVAIPADFPLDQGLQGASASDTAIGAPADLCGTPAWQPAGVVQERTVRESGIEYVEEHQLAVFDGPSSATAAVDTVRQAVDGCAETTGDTYSGYTVSVLEGDTGFDSFTWGAVDTRGAPTGFTWQLTRVGTAVLVLYSEGEMSAETQQSSADDQTAATRQIAPQMCLWTEDGC